MQTRFALLAVTVLAAPACTSTVVLHETIPVAVTADKPEPPPPPPPPPKRVEVEEERIRVDEKIHFEFDSAKIREESHELLDEIAQVIKDHPELTKIRIEGHTDIRGSEAYNQDLSKRRAQSVTDYLVDQGGVERKRLIVKGYGFSEPIATNETEEGMAKNRRVEFDILERDPSAAAPDGEDPEGEEAAGEEGDEEAGAGDDAGEGDEADETEDEDDEGGAQ